MARHAEADREYFLRVVATDELEDTMNAAYEQGFRGVAYEPLDVDSADWRGGGERWIVSARRPLPQLCPACHRSLLNDCAESEEGVSAED